MGSFQPISLLPNGSRIEVEKRRDDDEQETTKGNSVSDATQGKHRSLRSLEWLNFFLADVQTGLGPFLAAYLASSGWNPGRVGYALTFGGLVAVAMQTPAGAVIDAVHRKRALLGVNLGVLVAGAFLLMGQLTPMTVYSAQLLIGGSGAFLGSTVAAITLGIVGAGAFDKQFGKNQAFKSAGNVFTALLVAYVSYECGYRAIFVVAAALAIPAAVRDALEGQPARHGPVHVRVHHRHAACHSGHCGVDWRQGCGEGSKTIF